MRTCCCQAYYGRTRCDRGIAVPPLIPHSHADEAPIRGYRWRSDDAATAHLTPVFISRREVYVLHHQMFAVKILLNTFIHRKLLYESQTRFCPNRIKRKFIV